MPVNVGIIGLGAIGNYLIDCILESDEFSITAVHDISKERYSELTARLKSPPPLSDIHLFPIETDVFIECASVAAVDSVVNEACKRGKTAIIASIGGFVLNPDLLDLVTKSNAKLILPSGAIGGLDILKALDKNDIEIVKITTRKNPKSVQGIKLDENDSPVEIFNGSAREAVKQFPKNINVAATLSLAGIGFDRTVVKIIADPKAERNVHQIDIQSKSGNYRITCENFPFERNPATSKLAAQSIWAALKSINDRIVVGL
jgi:aspartate dehydrogenase